MSTVNPTLSVAWSAVRGNDVYGQPVLVSQAPQLVAPIKLEFAIAHTTVRTDSSAIHGHGQESTANIVLLVRPNCPIMVDDLLTILGNRVRVTLRQPRYTVRGALDHYQLSCTAWK